MAKGAWRCPHCDVNYPKEVNVKLQAKCPKCKNHLSYFTNLKPSDNWREAVPEELQKDEKNPNTIHPATSDGMVLIYRDDTDSIHVMDEHVRKLGYVPEVGLVIRVAGKHYELEGYDAKHKSWWVQRMEFEHDLEEIRSKPSTVPEEPPEYELWFWLDE